MQSPEERLITILKQSGVDYVSTLPCEKIRALLDRLRGEFFHIPLTREEEGVGISAGLALAGKRPAMFVQSSGIGNMINALLSLTAFYELPLAIFVSQRGVYKEKIAAQLPMGRRLPKILRGAGIGHTSISTADELDTVQRKLPHVYKKNKVHAFLLSPAIFENSCSTSAISPPVCPAGRRLVDSGDMQSVPELTRYEIIETLAPLLADSAVVCNLGIPSKELYAVRHQPSNFYMLGSMGMATPIGLGISLAADKRVIVIDGDGSLLMNPGALATAAHMNPSNLTILAVDNSSYGSTGGQVTLTGSCVDLSLVAQGFGIRNIIRAGGRKQLIDAMQSPAEGLKFIHALALPGSAPVPNIPLHHLEIKRQVMEFLKS